MRTTACALAVVVAFATTCLTDADDKNQPLGGGTFRVGPDPTVDRRWKVPCSKQYEDDAVKTEGCTPLPGGVCDRFLVDEFLSEEEVKTLLKIARKGMAKGSRVPTDKVLGPTIMDVNMGWVLPSGAHQPLSIYRSGPLYSAEEYDMYRSVSDRLKAHVEGAFGLGRLYFTAPTFITRESQDMDQTWSPSTPHGDSFQTILTLYYSFERYHYFQEE